MNRKLFLFYKSLYTFRFVTKNNYRHHICTTVKPNLKLIHFSLTIVDHYSTHEAIVASYEEVKEIGEDKYKNVLLIDVREPEELAETGELPSSINIPLGNLENVLKDMSNEEFSKMYGRGKPNKNDPIIFSCKMGQRSASACNISQQLGFKNVKNYLGGWLEWNEKNQTTNVLVSCTQESNSKRYPQVSYEEVRILKDDPNYLLVDVREPSELQEQGSIPGSINIPLNDLENILTQVTASEFKLKYKREKPEKNFNIIFSCRSGVRSQMAQERAITLGFKNCINYSGSWLDWEERTTKAV